MSGKRAKQLRRQARREIEAGLPEAVMAEYRQRREEASAGVLRRHEKALKRRRGRSTADGPDVSEIAEAYGGGGHAHAAGFQSRFNILHGSQRETAT